MAQPSWQHSSTIFVCPVLLRWRCICCCKKLKASFSSKNMDRRFLEFWEQTWFQKEVISFPQKKSYTWLLPASLTLYIGVDSVAWEDAVEDTGSGHRIFSKRIAVTVIVLHKHECLISAINISISHFLTKKRSETSIPRPVFSNGGLPLHSQRLFLR